MIPPSPSSSSSSSSSSRRMIVPVIFSMIAIILGMIALATPGLMEIKTDNYYHTVHNKTQIGPTRVCFSSSSSSSSSTIDECKSFFNRGECELEIHYGNVLASIPFFHASSSCDQLGYFLGFLTIALITGLCSTIFLIYSHCTHRLDNFFFKHIYIFTSCISSITSIVALSLVCTIYMGELNVVQDDGYIYGHFNYGGTMIIFFAVFNLCSTVSYFTFRTKRLPSLNHHAMTQPLVATNVVYIPPVYDSPIDVEQSQYQPMEDQSTYYHMHPITSQQPQQL